MSQQVDGQSSPDEEAVAEDLFELDTIYVNTDRVGSDPLDIPANVTVVGSEELKQRNISDINELARTIPGVEVPRQTSGANPYNSFSGVTIRGVGGNRVQLQVDGSRMAESITDGTRDYFDTSFTKQVEVVRGPASVLWGADALGGIVALETIDPEDLLRGREKGGEVSLSYDSLDNASTGSVSYAQRLGDTLEVMFGYAHRDANEAEFSNARADGGIYGCPRNLSFGATPCNELDPTDISSDRGLFKAVWTPNANNRLEFSADILDRTTTVNNKYNIGPQFSSFTGAPTGETLHSDDRELDLSRKRFGLEHELTLDTGVINSVKTVLAYTPHSYSSSSRRQTTSAAGDSVITDDQLDFSEDFIELDIQADASFVTGSAQHNVIFGFDGDLTSTDYSRTRVTNNLTQGTVDPEAGVGFNFANAKTTRADIYIQDQIIFGDGRFELTPGLRYATYDIDPEPDADYQVAPGNEPRTRSDKRLIKSLGALYRFNDTYSMWAKYGEGFKMPTASQLYTSLPGAFFSLIPAPNLEPEEVKSYELGLRGEYGNGFFAVNVFRADYTNFIQPFYNIPGTSNYTYRNLSSVEIQGIEASGSWAFSDTLVGTFSASYQEGTQVASPGSAQTDYTAPPLTAVLSLAKDLPDYNLRLEAVGTFASAVKKTSGANDFKPGGYGLLDLHAQWQVIDNGYFNFSLLNAFDKRYFVANAANYGSSASAAVARTNPIELQTGAGRTFAVNFEYKF
ncbi:TonB-dependent hemoglobin/transferrin/lactoferrin family receptor [Shimia sp. R10_1]|uniref:TonB-dependent hemoglobin/transferrin/lactoferrin family receptor n=1 Tax=Shimia sp. R10_1 TaxID=2821095 RepID=UPI001AD9DCBA|nr:TonB-dependent hemoglobin/transferrin/lactoferrin family receptor [Shimia sp. R10_1]MBO9475231.1 TonB-dependent hemoglobin/transferrin/lactoferrin family receptor [Shimia sp. R10_1]